MLVLINLLDLEAIEELEEVQEVLELAGSANPRERTLLLRQIFSVGRSIGRRETLPMGRVPTVGEYLCLPMENDVWYRTEIVLHTPGHPSHVAEIWVLEENEEETKSVS